MIKETLKDRNKIVEHFGRTSQSLIEHLNPNPIRHGAVNDDRHDVDDGGNVHYAKESVHDDDDDDNDAMVYPSNRPTSQMLSPILPTELAITLWQIVAIPLLQYR